MLCLTIIKYLTVIAGISFLLFLGQLVYEVIQWQRDLREIDEDNAAE